MNKEKLKIIIVAAFGIFVLLVAALLLNSFFGAKNIGLKAKSSPVSNVSQNNSSTTSQSIAPSSADELKDQAENAANKGKIKEMIMKQMAAYRSTSSVNISNTFPTADKCLELKDSANKNICIVLWAEYAEDPSLCQKATSTELQDCQDKAYTAKALADKNVNLCANVKGVDIKRSCIARVVAAANLSEKDCTSLPNAEDLICTTYALVGRAKVLSDCDSIIDSGIKKICRDNFYADLRQK
jgi:hypothetical protein